MNLKIYGSFEIPIASLSLFDTVAILVLVPLMDRCVFPILRKKGLKLTMLQRIGIGFVFASCAMIVAGILEIMRCKAPTLSNQPSKCNSSILVTNINVLWQIPQYVLIGISEVFASITGLEFFYSQAPGYMRSVLMALFLLTTGLGSAVAAILIEIVNSGKKQWITNNLNDGHLDYYFFLLSALMFAIFLFFLYSSSRYEYRKF